MWWGLPIFVGLAVYKAGCMVACAWAWMLRRSHRLWWLGLVAATIGVGVGVGVRVVMFLRPTSWLQSRLQAALLERAL
jgi:hypothetical protein